MSVTRETIVMKAREYIGTKFQHQARIKYDRIDCAGLLICVGKELGLVEPSFDFTNYELLNDGTDLHELIQRYADEIPMFAALPGDIFTMMNVEYPQHCGFFTSIGIIHCTKRVVEHALDESWSDKIVACFRLRGVV